MCYATDATQSEDIKQPCLKNWQELSQLCPFAGYFTSVRLDSPFHRCKAFHSPLGFAVTNNPIEQFNRAIMSDYTLRARPKMGILIDQLLLCVRTEAVRSRPFATTIEPHADVVHRVREMIKANVISEVKPMHISMGFLTGKSPPSAGLSMLHVASDSLNRVYDPHDKRIKEALPVTASLSWQNARMETASIPASDWKVDLERKTCGYLIFLRDGCCIYLVYGLSVRAQLDCLGRARLVSRGRNKSCGEVIRRNVDGRSRMATSQGDRKSQVEFWAG
ncbi:unnamed protein product [Phytophthora fragariaefolia]|uniref:Unnamed protein product n=1 Tax=Phytophthora fragariaefolia TaxID=1490495 RepID=A0A9W6TP43_9STRA|nr:unnamed protein product [Phytophthora fragariaefolia]